MTRLRAHLSYSNLISTLCLFLVLAGGTAYALDGSNTVFSDDLVNGEVEEADVGTAAVHEDEIAQSAVRSNELRDDTITNGDVAPNSLRSSRIHDGTLSGVDVASNSLEGADIDEGTLDVGNAARAYAVVDPASCTGTPGTCTALQSNGISSVTRDAVGQYCVTATGINSGQVPAAVTVDWSTTEEPEGNAAAMTVEGGGCGPDQGFFVVTDRQAVVNVDSGGGMNNAPASGPAAFANDVGFTILIP